MVPTHRGSLLRVPKAIALHMLSVPDVGVLQREGPRTPSVVPPLDPVARPYYSMAGVYGPLLYMRTKQLD